MKAVIVVLAILGILSIMGVFVAFAQPKCFTETDHFKTVHIDKIVLDNGLVLVDTDIELYLDGYATYYPCNGDVRWVGRIEDNYALLEAIEQIEESVDTLNK